MQEEKKIEISDKQDKKIEQVEAKGEKKDK